MQCRTKWGLFIGSEDDYEDFAKEMTRRENPEPTVTETKVEGAVEKKTEEKPAPVVKRTKSSSETTASTRKKTSNKRSAK